MMDMFRKTPSRSPSRGATPKAPADFVLAIPTSCKELILQCLQTIETRIQQSERNHTTLRNLSTAVKDHLHGHRPFALLDKGIDSEMSFVVCPLRYACHSGAPLAISAAVESIEKILAHGFVTDTMQYIPPDVAKITEKKKSKGMFGGLTDVHNFGDLLKLGKDEARANKNIQLDLTPESSAFLVPQLVAWIAINTTLPDEGVQQSILRALQSTLGAPNVTLHGHTFLTVVRAAFNVFIKGVSEAIITGAKQCLSQLVSLAYRRIEQEMGNRASGQRRSFAIINTSSRKAEALCLSIVNSLIGIAVGEGPSPISNESTLVRSPSCLHQNNLSTSKCEEILEFNATVEGELARFGTLVQRDGYQLMRGLCRLAMRKLPDPDPKDPHALLYETRCKILSINLLQNIVGHSDEVLQNIPEFVVTGVKGYVSQVVIENSLCSSIDVNRAAIHLFWDLLDKYRDSLKVEVSIMLTEVVATLLDSSKTSFGQKELTLGLVNRLCEDPQIICDIFVNYDCVVGQNNVFEKLVGCLSKVTTTSHVVPNWFTVPEEKALKGQAVECTLVLLRSLIDWMSRHVAPNEESDSPLDRNSVPKEDFEDSSVPEVAHEAEDDFTREKRLKDELNLALSAFTQDPKKTVKRMLAQGVLPKDPKVVALWLRQTKGLDRVAIGEALSASDEFGKQVLRDYVDLFNFSGLAIDEALRKLMSSYKICGEAQVIDRTMLLFSAKFVRDTEGKEGWTADSAYVASFSIMMLSTDMYNPNVAKKDKMTKGQFIANFQRVDDCKGMPKEIFEGIFDRIAAKEIKLDNDATSGPSSGASPGSKRRDQTLSASRSVQLESEQRDSILSNTRHLFRQQEGEANTVDTSYFRADRVHHVRPMWEIANAQVLVALITSFESVDNEEVRTKCLQGLDRSVHISCLTGLRSIRDTYVSALLKLTNLRMYPKIPIYPRHARAIRTLLILASVEGNSLRSSWYDVMKCVSYLSRHHLVSGSSDGLDVQKGANSNLVATLMDENVDEQLVDRLFTLSTELSGEGIVYFVESLSRVCKDEVEGKRETAPRVYALQKLVEVAEWNMHRIQLVWTQIWSPVATCLTDAGLHSELRIAMFAVDALRQLSVKFIEREELMSFNFQNHFLKPFESIFSGTKSVETRELILRCIIQIIQIRGTRIMSGWKSLLSCLSRAASDKVAIITVSSFEAAEIIISTCLHYVATPEHLTDFVSCMIAFAFNTHNVLLSQKAIVYLEVFARFLKYGVPLPAHPMMVSRQMTIKASTTSRALEPLENLNVFLETELNSDPDNILSVVSKGENFSGLTLTRHKVEVRVWLAILSGFCTLIATHPRIELRQTAMSQLFNTLRSVRSYFTTEVWSHVFTGAVFPIFDHVFCDFAMRQDTEEVAWQVDAITQALENITALYYGDVESLRPLLGDILQHTFVNCFRRYDDVFTDLSLRSLTNFLAVGSASPNTLNDTDWEVVCKVFTNMVDAGLPKALLNISGDNPSVENIAEKPIVAKLRTCTKLLQQLHRIVGGVAVGPRPVILAECIRASMEVVMYCFELGRDSERLVILQEQRANIHSTLLELMSQTCTTYLALITSLCETQPVAKAAALVYVPLVLRQWIMLTSKQNPDILRVHQTVVQRVACEALTYIANVSLGGVFKEWMGAVYALCCDIVRCAEKETGERVSAIMRRIGEEYRIGFE